MVEGGQAGVDADVAGAVHGQARHELRVHASTLSICAPSDRSRSSTRSYPRSIQRMFPIRDCPSAHSAAISMAQPARTSGLSILCPYRCEGPTTHSAVRVAQDHARAHVAELVHKEQPALEHLLEDEDLALRLRRDDERDRGEVGREGRPGAVLDLGDHRAEVLAHDQFLPGRNTDARLAYLDRDPQPVRRRAGWTRVVWTALVDGHVAAGHSGAADEASDLDVVGQCAGASAQLAHAFDTQRVRPDSLDTRAQRHEEMTEILHMRLTGSVDEDGLCWSADIEAMIAFPVAGHAGLISGQTPARRAEPCSREPEGLGGVADTL